MYSFMFPEKTVKKPASPTAAPPAPKPKTEINPKPETPKAVPAGFVLSLSRALSLFLSHSLAISLLCAPTLFLILPLPLSLSLLLSPAVSRTAYSPFSSHCLSHRHM